MGRTARTLLGTGVMLAVAMPAIIQVPPAATQALQAAAETVTARQFPAEDRPWVAAREERWESCSTIPVLTNIPEEMRNDVADALQKLNDATGARFHIAGRTDRTPTTRWVIDGQRAHPEDPYPAVIIAVAHHRETDLLERHWHGAAVANPHEGRYVTGAVVIAEDTLRRWPPGSPQLNRLLLHELGHLAGLGHAREGTIMHAHVRNEGPDTYTEDDLEGLSRMFTCGG